MAVVQAAEVRERFERLLSYYALWVSVFVLTIVPIILC